MGTHIANRRDGARVKRIVRIFGYESAMRVDSVHAAFVCEIGTALECGNPCAPCVGRDDADCFRAVTQIPNHAPFAERHQGGDLDSELLSSMTDLASQTWLEFRHGELAGWKAEPMDLCECAFGTALAVAVHDNAEARQLSRRRNLRRSDSGR